jgi:hypothetical protein
LGVLPAWGQTQHLKEEAELRRTIEGVIASVAASNYAGAWKALKPLSVVPAPEFDVFEAQFSSQLGGTLQRYGSPTGYELVKEQKVGTSLIQLTYVLQHEKAPMRWMFIAYRSPKGWAVTDFKFDGNTSALFSSGA